MTTGEMVGVGSLILGTIVALLNSVASRREIEDLKKQVEKLESFKDEVNRELRATAVDVARAVSTIQNRGSLP